MKSSFLFIVASMYDKLISLIDSKLSSLRICSNAMLTKLFRFLAANCETFKLEYHMFLSTLSNQITKKLSTTNHKFIGRLEANTSKAQCQES